MWGSSWGLYFLLYRLPITSMHVTVGSVGKREILSHQKIFHEFNSLVTSSVAVPNSLMYVQLM